jgi:aerobic-type carbon monoxide dehydrogenase small subunit (CoxS/CutS family)
MATIDLELTINGEKVVAAGIDGDRKLVDFLREDLSLTGTKFGCGIAVCRVCTVALQRVPGAHCEAIRSCTTPLSEVHTGIITTVEGLAQQGALHPLQSAFLENFAFECGYSSPGFLMASYCLLDKLRRSPVPRGDVDAAIEEAVGQHICRCTGYVRYHRAIRHTILSTPGLVV